jgi:hypothetical protein
MAKYISINVVSSVDSGIGAADSFQDGEHLINVDQIVEVSQTSATNVTILLESAIVAADTIVITPSTTQTGAVVAPTNTAGALYRDALNYSLTANPGGVKSKCVLGFDQAATPLRMYWRDFTQA